MYNLLPSIFDKDIFNKDRVLQFPRLWEEFASLQNNLKEQGLIIYTEKNNIVVEAPLPGLKQEEINVTFNNGVLWIKGDQKQEVKDKTFYTESTRSYSYRVVLPDNVDEKQEPNATYTDGILKIVFPKAKTSEAKQITVKTEKKK